MTEKSSTGEYKVRGRYFLLTYPHCDAPKESMAEAVWALLPEETRESVVASVESHQDGTPHIHIAAKLAERKFYSNCHWADVLGYHGNYLQRKDWRSATMYVMKHDKNPHVIGEKPPTQKRNISDQIADDLVDGMSLANVARKHRGAALRLGRNLSIFQNMIRVEEMKREPLPKMIEQPEGSPARTIQDWICQNLLNGWINYPDSDTFPEDAIPKTMPFRTPQLYIHGFSGAGKTTTFNTLEKRFKTFKPNTQQFFWDGFTPEHELIIFDEFMGKHISFELLKKILDGQKLSLVNKGGTVFKDKNIPVIMACNHAPAMNYEKHFQRFPAGEQELMGRLLVVTLSPPLLDSNNVPFNSSELCHIFHQ